MDQSKLRAKATVEVKSPASKVWKALTEPELIKKYMFGAEVVTNWKKDGDITWSGEMQGKKYEDKGKVLQIEPNSILSYSHFSPLSGKPDLPENYHTVTIHLEPSAQGTTVSLTQDKISSTKEQEESQKNWTMMLETLKKVVEEMQ